jgi:DNA-binding IscR family transcriptional regulator
MLHVLLHMARHDGPFTSEQMANMLNTNAVVVRRTMAGLRKAGYVSSDKGSGGGWSIACDFTRLTLLDIHQALGGARLFAIGNDSYSSQCGVERVVNAAIDDALHQAEALLIKRLASVTLADLARDFDTLRRKEGGSMHHLKTHTG